VLHLGVLHLGVLHLGVLQLVVLELSRPSRKHLVLSGPFPHAFLPLCLKEKRT